MQDPLDPWGRPEAIRPHRNYVDGVSVSIVAERVEHLDAYGKLATESLRDFSRTALRRLAEALQPAPAADGLNPRS